MSSISLEDKLNRHDYRGEIEFIFKDKNGNVVGRHIEPNIVKIFAKEMLAHRIGHFKIWDPNANSGAGAWVTSPIDPAGEMSAKYILFGASFDKNGLPLDVNDPRYYHIDPVTQTPIPVRLEPGADFDGGLINAVPLAEPNRPLKRVESIGFEPTYQPAGTPQLQGDVRAVNNIVLFETTLRPNEYNGFGLTNSDFFTITEVALAGGKELNAIGACECDPKDALLEGHTGSAGARTPLSATASGTDTITLDPSVTEVDLIKIGDQIKIVGPGGSSPMDTLNQVSPFYLVIAKQPGGRDIQLDRVPSHQNQSPIVGSIGVFRSTLRIFSHRILNTPVKKTANFEIICRWRIIFN